MKITQSYVRSVIRHTQIVWNDRSYRNFASTKEYEAVRYAIGELESQRCGKLDLKEVIKAAYSYINSISAGV